MSFQATPIPPTNGPDAYRRGERPEDIDAFFNTPNDVQQEIYERAKRLIEIEGENKGYLVDSVGVADRFIIEHVQGSGVWIYQRKPFEPHAVYAQSESGNVMTPGKPEVLVECLKAFQAAMVLDDLAGT